MTTTEGYGAERDSRRRRSISAADSARTASAARWHSAARSHAARAILCNSSRAEATVKLCLHSRPRTPDARRYTPPFHPRAPAEARRYGAVDRGLYESGLSNRTPGSGLP